MSSHRGSEGENTASTVWYTHEGQPKRNPSDYRLPLGRGESPILPITPSLGHCSNKYKLAREGEKDREKDEDLKKKSEIIFFFFFFK